MSDIQKKQEMMINAAIKRAGSIDALAHHLGVCRQTIFKWRKGDHEMKMSMALEIMKMTGSDK